MIFGSKKLSNPKVFDDIFNGKDPPTVYINGNRVSSGTAYRDIKLHAHDEIALVYGTPPDSIPSVYDFPYCNNKTNKMLIEVFL